VAEVTGFVRAMLAHTETVPVEGDVVDLVGTGGDRLRSFNVTTLAAIITAGGGVAVCKHGNRAASSVDSGRAAEVLDELVRVSSISALDAEVG
jgi:anthranilate phosphoribosyltransferase